VEQGRQLGRRQPAQLHNRASFVPAQAPQRAERRDVRPLGDHGQQPLVAEPPQRVGQRLQRGLVGPLGIVDDGNDREKRGGLGGDPHQVGADIERVRPRPTAPKHGHHRHIAGLAVGVELFDQAKIQMLFALVSAGPQHGHPVRDRSGERTQQRRLADAGGTLDDNELRLALHGRPERALQHHQLVVASDQRVRAGLGIEHRVGPPGVDGDASD
jgi:hypothetical protein